jgi:hypothetical protein
VRWPIFRPDLTIATLRARYAVTLLPEVLDIYIEGYRKAGFPEE